MMLNSKKSVDAGGGSDRGSQGAGGRGGGGAGGRDFELAGRHYFE